MSDNKKRKGEVAEGGSKGSKAPKTAMHDQLSESEMMEADPALDNGDDAPLAKSPVRSPVRASPVVGKQKAAPAAAAAPAPAKANKSSATPAAPTVAPTTSAKAPPAPAKTVAPAAVVAPKIPVVAAPVVDLRKPLILSSLQLPTAALVEKTSSDKHHTFRGVTADVEVNGYDKDQKNKDYLEVVVTKFHSFSDSFTVKGEIVNDCLELRVRYKDVRKNPRGKKVKPTMDQTFYTPWVKMTFMPGVIISVRMSAIEGGIVRQAPTISLPAGYVGPALAQIEIDATFGYDTNDKKKQAALAAADPKAAVDPKAKSTSEEPADAAKKSEGDDEVAMGEDGKPRLKFGLFTKIASIEPIPDAAGNVIDIRGIDTDNYISSVYKEIVKTNLAAGRRFPIPSDFGDRDQLFARTFMLPFGYSVPKGMEVQTADGKFVPGFFSTGLKQGDEFLYQAKDKAGKLEELIRFYFNVDFMHQGLIWNPATPEGLSAMRTCYNVTTPWKGNKPEEKQGIMLSDTFTAFAKLPLSGFLFAAFHKSNPDITDQRFRVVSSGEDTEYHAVNVIRVADYVPDYTTLAETWGIEVTAEWLKSVSPKNQTTRTKHLAGISEAIFGKPGKDNKRITTDNGHRFMLSRTLPLVLNDYEAEYFTANLKGFLFFVIPAVGDFLNKFGDHNRSVLEEASKLEDPTQENMQAYVEENSLEVPTNLLELMANLPLLDPKVPAIDAAGLTDFPNLEAVHRTILKEKYKLLIVAIPQPSIIYPVETHPVLKDLIASAKPPVELACLYDNIPRFPDYVDPLFKLAVPNFLPGDAEYIKEVYDMNKQREAEEAARAKQEAEAQLALLEAQA